MPCDIIMRPKNHPPRTDDSLFAPRGQRVKIDQELIDDRETRERILAITSSHAKQLGIRKSTLHYLRKKAQNEESFIVYETTRRKIQRHREVIKS
jgi:hypothetical protein